MNRFLKSAAFPILVVILLAYFAQQLILNKGDSAQSVGWSGFVQKLEQKGQVEKLKIDPSKNSMLFISPAYERIWGRTCASLRVGLNTRDDGTR